MYFSFASKDKGSCNVSTCKFIRFPLNSYTFHALIRFFTPQFSKKRTIFHLSILIGASYDFAYLCQESYPFLQKTTNV